METMIRGYAIPLTARFILEEKAVLARVPPETVEELQKLAEMRPPSWLPRKEAVRLWHILEKACPADDEATHQILIRCGEAIANEAISTFLKLLLKVLTPSMFAKKFPDIWTHEHKGGHVSVDLTGTVMTIEIKDVEGFDHVSPVGLGFVHVALKAIGMKEIKLKDHTWSRKAPGPRDVRIEISWK